MNEKVLPVGQLICQVVLEMSSSVDNALPVAQHFTAQNNTVTLYLLGCTKLIGPTSNPCPSHTDVLFNKRFK